MRIPRNLNLSPQRVALLWLGSIGLALPGCGHLYIPSVRFGEDPTPLTATSHGEPAGRSAVGAYFCGHPHADLPEDMLLADPELAAAGSLPAHGDASPPPPEVPWPRFHPLPTRPVHGP